jgi:hypothetical protein
MSTSKTRDLPAALDGVRRRFEDWRRARRARSRIPNSLWAAAVRAAGRWGIHRTARALRLDYYSLKDRVEQHSAASPAETADGAAFLELPPPAVGGFVPVPVGRCECTLELEDAGGTKMRVSLKGVPTPDLAALCRSFRK